MRRGRKGYWPVALSGHGSNCCHGSNWILHRPEWFRTCTLEDVLYIQGIRFWENLLSHKRLFSFQFSFPSVLFNIRREYPPSRLQIRIKYAFEVQDVFPVVTNYFPGPYSKNTGPRCFSVRNSLRLVRTVKTSGRYSLRRALALS